MALPAAPSLIGHFSALEDPRQSWKVVYPLPEVLLVVLCGTLAGAEDFVEIRQWAAVHLDFLRRLLPFEAGLPSHDTLNDVVNAINGTLFSECFTAWVEGLREAAPAPSVPEAPEVVAPEVVAIDGKTSRRTHDRAKGRGPLHMVSAWASSQRLVLGQQACEAKSNEITAIPLLLERLALAGALVTIDAMGCQTRIAQAILDRGGDYLLAVKDNQSNLHDDIRRTFDDPGAKLHSRLDVTDGDHGRVEVRRHRVSHDVGWLNASRRYPGAPSFPGVRAIAMVEAEVERGGSTSLERRYYLCSLALDARLFARAVRCHWHVESVLQTHTERSSR